MPIPQNKTELKEAIELNYNKLKADLVDIPKAMTTKKTMLGHSKGTKMSPCDCISYLIGWGELVLKWHKQDLKKQDIHFPEIGYQWNELGALAQKFYKDYDHLEFEQLLKKLDHTLKKILKIIDGLSNDFLYHKEWYKQYTFGRMIQLNTASPYKNARQRIRKWKKENNL